MDDRIGNQPGGSQILASLTLSFQDFIDAIPAGAVVVDEHGTVLITNAELDRQFGYEPGGLLDRSVDMLVPVGLRGGHAGLRSQYVESEQTRTMGGGRALQGQRKDGSTFPVEVGLRALSAGNAHFVLAVVSDRSDHFRARASEAQEKALGLELAHQETVAREMGHRVKNLMATVAALVSLSARGASTPREMEESLRGRILALSSVIDLAFNAPQSRSPTALSIEDILQAVLAPFTWTQDERARIALTGPELTVGQRPSEVLALVFHELATNAMKYGALQRPEDRLYIEWRKADAMLNLSWREEVGQFHGSAPKQGFGTTLVARLIEAEFGGRVERQVSSSGWTTQLNIPVASLGG
jgi:PAS domain S-box-containing protein